jgi:ATP-dependent helicase/nuclease subunit A
MDLLALMQFALLPEDNLNLATILRGPMIGMSEDHLMTLALRREGILWRSLIDKSAIDPTFAKAHDYLTRWLNAADFMTPFTMLAQILNEACPASAVSGRRAIWSRLGPDALDPIDELLSAAQDFSRRHTPSLQAFLHWLMATETEIKRELDRGGGQVRIMTVHASKGLEAPIVFLPDTSSVPRVQDVPKFLWNEDGVPFYVSHKPDGGEAKRLWGIARQKQVEEYRRLLYVALTRAANCLYIGGWETAKREPDHQESWYNLIVSALKPYHMPSALGPDEPQAAIVLADPVFRRAEKHNQPAEKPVAKIELPAWALRSVPVEPAAIKSVSPSRLAQALSAATPDKAFLRGRIIHRLLQGLPDMDETQREFAAARFLTNPQHRLTEEQQKEIADEVMGLLRNPGYAPLFGSGSRAEVPLAGHIGGQFIEGQVDRLCVRDDGIWIVDYKTNRPPPEKPTDVPEAYRLQLAQYRDVLREIYPHKPIHCFLLWTYSADMMELSGEILSDA